jgi:hypothetical protein
MLAGGFPWNFEVFQEMHCIFCLNNFKHKLKMNLSLQYKDSMNLDPQRILGWYLTTLWTKILGVFSKDRVGVIS